MASQNDEEIRNRVLKSDILKLLSKVKESQWPIVYSQSYNIHFFGMEKIHPFDSGKWGKVFHFLQEEEMLKPDDIVEPCEANENDLLVVHTKSYLNSLKWSFKVATVTEVPPVAFLPNFIVQRKVLTPLRYQVAGTILAAQLALKRGWAINIGGGFHHCSYNSGGGFCVYADITLAIKFLFQTEPESVKNVLIIDLDAHQGNGHERDFIDDPNVKILDCYNRSIYPFDGFAKRGIDWKVELNAYTRDDTYLNLISKYIKKAMGEFKADFIVYNAGTDILIEDPLGCLDITAEGIILRDQLVFQHAQKAKIPILMVTSGGYQKSTARIIADSILNLKKQNLISLSKNCETANMSEITSETFSGLRKQSPV